MPVASSCLATEEVSSAISNTNIVFAMTARIRILMPLLLDSTIGHPKYGMRPHVEAMVYGCRSIGYLRRHVDEATNVGADL